MAAPNIVNVATITGKSVGAALGTTTTTAILSNAGSSNKVYKVNCIICSNIAGTDTTVTCSYYDGSTDWNLASTINVPGNTTLVISDKNSSIYHEEGDSIRAGASTASRLELVVSYEELS